MLLFFVDANLASADIVPVIVEGESGLIAEASSNYIDVENECIHMIHNWSRVTYRVEEIPVEGVYSLKISQKKYYPDVQSNPILRIDVNGITTLHTQFKTNDHYYLSDLGFITLSAGENTIEFIITNNQHFTMDYFILTKVEACDTGQLLINEINGYTSVLNIDGYKGTYSDMKLVSTHAFLRSGCITITENIVVRESGKYKMTISAGSTQRHSYSIQYSIENTIQTIDSKIFEATGGQLIYSDEDIGELYLAAGNYTFIITYNLQNSNGGMCIRYFTLEKEPLISDFFVSSFELLDQCGYPAPNVLKGGIAITASVKIRKFSDNIGDSRLIIAQYSSEDKLINVAIKAIDFSKINIGVESTIEQTIALKAGYGDGYVKSFLWEKNTLNPLCENIYLREYPIFNLDVLEKEVTYQAASNLGYGGYDYAEDNYNIQAIFYDGSIYNGNKTKVFAYLGIPETKENEKIPAVVLIHGILGKADIDWVKKWNARGYAAIAMDLYGNGPDRNKHPYAGPNPYDNSAFASLASGSEAASMYHAVVNVIAANNILRTIPEIDNKNIGIVGISWGGIVAGIAVGVDSRFAFAATVFGGGYLYKSQTYLKNMFTDDKLVWDPSNFIKKAEIPILWVNSDHDGSFSMDSFSKSYEISTNGYMCIYPDLWHLHKEAQNVREIYNFADSIVKGGKGFIRITNAEYSGEIAYAEFNTPEGIIYTDAVLYYNNQTELPYGGGNNNILWTEVEPYEESNGLVKFILPEEAVRFYINLIDNRGNIMSSKLITR